MIVDIATAVYVFETDRKDLNITAGEPSLDAIGK